MLHLLPVPKHIEMIPSDFLLTMDSYIMLPPGASELARTAAQQLQQELHAACGFAPAISCGQPRSGDIALGYTQGEAQGYALTIAPENVWLKGYDEQGLLHGAQTLRQIIRQCGWTLPGLTIEDAPDMPVRGFYHDQTRGRVGTLAWLMALADQACFYKLNHLQLYVEHTYLFRDLPELWSVAGTPLTAQDIMALDDYCAQRGIELVPSLSCFGHLLELMRVKRFASLCELEHADQYPSTMFNRMVHHTVDPLNQDAFHLVTQMIDEFMALFRSDKFNICADETFDLGRGRNAGKDVGEMYLGFLKKLCAHVAQRGKTPMFWGDILLQHPKALQDLPKGAICLNWCYEADVTPEGTRAIGQTGAVQYVCPGVASWNHWVPAMTKAQQNICRMALYGKEQGAKGLLNTDWGDYGHITDPRLSLPGMIAGACAAWGELPEEHALGRAISRIAWGDSSECVVDLLTKLSKCQLHSWEQLADYREGMLPTGEPISPHRLMCLCEDEVAAADQQIQVICQALRACALSMPTHMRPLISCFLLSAEAIGMWNHVQCAVTAGRRDPSLTQQMLRWLHRYERCWRETSQESELHRIRDMTRWYAGQLD